MWGLSDVAFLSFLLDLLLGIQEFVKGITNWSSVSSINKTSGRCQAMRGAEINCMFVIFGKQTYFSAFQFTDVCFGWSNVTVTGDSFCKILCFLWHVSQVIFSLPLSY